MAKRTNRTDPIVLLLTERNLELELQISDSRRVMDVLRAENDTLRFSLERPNIALFTNGQLDTLSCLLAERILLLANSNGSGKALVN